MLFNKFSKIANARTIAAALALTSVSACSTLQMPQISQGHVEPLAGSSVSTNRTPLDISYLCYARELKNNDIPQIAVAVGSVPDYTGKLSQFEGSAVTQGGSLMVFSALSKLGNTISIHERFDTRVTELELAYSDKQRLGDGQMHVVNGQPVPWEPYYGGTIERSDVYLVGGITELNYNIRSSGAEARFGQTGPKARTFTLNVAIDLRLVDSKSLRVWSAASVQKQIIGQEVGFEVFRFASGDNLVDINVGAKAQEPIQFAVRSALEVATLQLLGDYTGISEEKCLPDEWKLPSEEDLEQANLEFDIAPMSPLSKKASIELVEPVIEAPVPQPAPEQEAPNTKSPEADYEAKQSEEPQNEEATLARFRSDCVLCPDMAHIEGGDFFMGSPPNEPGHTSVEGPQTQISLEDFYIGRDEVTFTEWDACVADRRCRPVAPNAKEQLDGNMPITGISWDEAQTYVEWLSDVTQYDYRLPSEAEWEYAARAGSTTAYWWGNEFDASKVSMKGALPVTDLPRNPNGMSGVAGNVREWVQDGYARSLSSKSRDGQPFVRPNCDLRVIRGGTTSHDKYIYRSANRARVNRHTKSSKIGFRVARAVTPNDYTKAE